LVDTLDPKSSVSTNSTISAGKLISPKTYAVANLKLFSSSATKKTFLFSFYILHNKPQIATFVFTIKTLCLQ